MSKEWFEGHTHVKVSISEYKGLKERVQELEEIIETNGSAFNSLENMYIDLEKQNERYREGLEFYADKEIYEEIKHEPVYQDGFPIEPPYGEPPTIYYDRGETARKRLGYEK